MSDLLNDLIKYRDEVIDDRDRAGNPPPYMHERDYSYYDGKEFAYDEVVYALNKLIESHSVSE